VARQENPREDLLAEATALVERAELRVTGSAEPIVVGFRRHGAASIFFGQDAAYHFNAANQLRRAFLCGTLFKADCCRLVALVRRRTVDEVELIRHDLDEDETAEFLATLHQRLAAFHTALDSGQVKLLRQVPDAADLIPRIAAWLSALQCPILIARSPRVE
jgi:hypothetical protein